MSSTEITACEDACNKPIFPLPIELRVKVYEQLLVRLDGSLKPHGFQRYTVKSHYHGENCISIDILLTCRTIYEEALPILYGKNILAFHDNNFFKRVLPFPEEHLIMIKHVTVEMSPSNYTSAEKMGNLLMLLGTSGVNLVSIHININILEEYDKECRTLFHALPPLSLFDRFLIGDHPIVAGLFSLKTAKKVVIEMENEARFEPGVASALKEAFMKEGTAYGRSISIVRCCHFLHWALEKGRRCPRCGLRKDESIDGIVLQDYEDDMLSR